MATTLTLNISIPDADVPDVIAALKLRYASNGVPNPTQAQLRTALEADVRQQLVGLTLQYRRDQAAIVAPVLS